MRSSSHHMSPRFALGLALIGFALAPAHAGAQSLGGIAPGARVRVEIPTAEQPGRGHERVQSLAGTLAAVHGDTVSLLLGPASVAVNLPRTAIQRLYLSGGRPPRWRTALRGAIAPAVLGSAVSALGMAIRRSEDRSAFGRTVASSALWGAASGAAFGAWSQRERWRRVSLAAVAPLAAVTGTGAEVPRAP